MRPLIPSICPFPRPHQYYHHCRGRDEETVFESRSLSSSSSLSSIVVRSDCRLPSVSNITIGDWSVIHPSLFDLLQLNVSRSLNHYFPYSSIILFLYHYNSYFLFPIAVKHFASARPFFSQYLIGLSHYPFPFCHVSLNIFLSLLYHFASL